MFKKKLGIIFLCLVLVISFMIPIVRAEDEANTSNSSTDNVVMPINEEVQNTQTQVENNLKKGDVFLTGDDVKVDYIVDGNLFVFANNVTISSQIGGDAFIFANSVTITNQGYVFSNLFTIASNIDIQGIVYDVYSYSKDINVSGYIYRDLKSQSQNFKLNGTIARNAFVSSDNIEFNTKNNSQDNSTIATKARVQGDFNYSSNSEKSIQDGIVEGNINYSSNVAFQNSTPEYAISLLSFLLALIIIWLLCLWLAPKFLEKSYNLIHKKPLKVIGIGILAPIVILAISIILLILVVTANLSAFLISMLFGFATISQVIFTIILSKLICNKLKITKKRYMFCALVILGLVLWFLTIIPYLGLVIDIISIIIGLGIIFSNIFIKNIDKSKNEKKENK